MKKPTVLIVEDDKEFRDAIQTVFERNGFIVTTEHNGKDALSLAKRICPDLVILDVMLPEKDGYFVCHHLKANKITSRIPVIIMTSLSKNVDGKNGAEQLAKGHQADAFFEKPVDPDTLIAKSRELITVKNEKKDEKKKILLIDDDPDFIAGIKTVLDENGYKTVVVYTGEDGLIAVKKERPSIVLLDVMLPGIDGYSVCQALKDDIVTKSIPVILLTSVSEKLVEPGYAKAIAVTHQADDFLEKPVDPKKLLKKIRQYIGPMRRLI